MTIAYLRISTEKQHLDNQRDAILKFASKENIVINKWHTDTVSGTISQNKRTLGNAIDKLGKDDVIIVSEISRLSRKMLEIMSILNICVEKGIILHCIKEGLRFGDDMNSKIMGFAFGMSAEIERTLISSRTKEALAYRRSQGVILGRPVGSKSKILLLEDNLIEIRQMIENKISLSYIARQYNVARGTLYSFLKTNGMR